MVYTCLIKAFTHLPLQCVTVLAYRLPVGRHHAFLVELYHLHSGLSTGACKHTHTKMECISIDLPFSELVQIIDWYLRKQCSGDSIILKHSYIHCVDLST